MFTSTLKNLHRVLCFYAARRLYTNVGFWLYRQNMLAFHFIDSKHVAIPVYTRLFSLKSAAKHLANCTWGILLRVQDPGYYILSIFIYYIILYYIILYILYIILYFILYVIFYIIYYILYYIIIIYCISYIVYYMLYNYYILNIIYYICYICFIIYMIYVVLLFIILFGPSRFFVLIKSL